MVSFGDCSLEAKAMNPFSVWFHDRETPTSLRPSKHTRRNMIVLTLSHPGRVGRASSVQNVGLIFLNIIWNFSLVPQLPWWTCGPNMFEDLAIGAISVAETSKDWVG